MGDDADEICNVARRRSPQLSLSVLGRLTILVIETSDPDPHNG